METGCGGLAVGISTLCHCWAVGVAAGCMLVEEVDLVLCFVHIVVARAISYCKRYGLYIRCLRGHTSSFLDDRKDIVYNSSNLQCNFGIWLSLCVN